MAKAGANGLARSGEDHDKKPQPKNIQQRKRNEALPPGSASNQSPFRFHRQISPSQFTFRAPSQN
jgi:hypothetical protein